MKLLPAAFIILLLLIVPGNGAAATTIFLACGQSNMLGVNSTSKLPWKWRPLPANLKMFVGKKQIHRFDEHPTFGPEVSFLWNYCTAHPEEQVLCIKYAVGGTTLWGDWYPDDFKRSTLRIYDNMLNCVRLVLTSLSLTGPIDTLLWVQGELDGNRQIMAAEYAANLVYFVQRVKGDLHSPQMKFITGAPSNLADFTLQVQQAQAQAVAILPNAGLVNTKGFTLVDTVHFDSQSTLELGRRLWERLKEMRGGQ